MFFLLMACGPKTQSFGVPFRSLPPSIQTNGVDGPLSLDVDEGGVSLSRASRRGKILWRQHLGSNKGSSTTFTVAPDERVVLVRLGMELVMVSMADGSELWRRELAGDVTWASDSSSVAVGVGPSPFARLGLGEVHVLNVEDGKTENAVHEVTDDALTGLVQSFVDRWYIQTSGDAGSAHWSVLGSGGLRACPSFRGRGFEWRDQWYVVETSGDVYRWVDCDSEPEWVATIPPPIRRMEPSVRRDDGSIEFQEGVRSSWLRDVQVVDGVLWVTPERSRPRVVDGDWTWTSPTAFHPSECDGLALANGGDRMACVSEEYGGVVQFAVASQAPEAPVRALTGFRKAKPWFLGDGETLVIEKQEFAFDGTTRLTIAHARGPFVIQTTAKKGFFREGPSGALTAIRDGRVVTWNGRDFVGSTLSCPSPSAWVWDDGSPVAVCDGIATRLTDGAELLVEQAEFWSRRVLYDLPGPGRLALVGSGDPVVVDERGVRAPTVDEVARLAQLTRQPGLEGSTERLVPTGGELARSSDGNWVLVFEDGRYVARRRGKDTSDQER